MKSITVRIPQPCHERWAEMQPTERGRFCASCRKIVVDYTALSDRELVRLLNQASASARGRFSNEQLNRPLVLPHPAGSPVWQHWLGLLTVGLFGWQTTRAQVSQTTPSIQSSTLLPSQQSFAAPSSRDTTGPDAGRVFSGIVVGIDSLGKSYPILGANVVVAGTTLITQTDRAGTFRLSIPADVPISLVTVVVSAIGFTHQNVDPFSLALDSTIVLNENAELLAEVVSVGQYEVTSRPSGWEPSNKAVPHQSRWQRIKHKFFHRAG